MSRSVTDLQLPAREKCIAFESAVRNQLKVQPIIVHTLRTWAEQAALYAKGRTLPGVIVTNAKPGYSWHNFACAWDTALLDKDGNITWKGPWQEIGKLGEGMGLVWGGRFDADPKTPGVQADLGHFEYPYVLRDGVETKVTLAQLRSEYNVLLARQGGEKPLQWHS